MTHNHHQIAKIDSAYTIQCMEGHHADSLLLALDEFLPNLRIFDSAGTEYPVMAKEDVNKLLEYERANPYVNQVAKKVECEGAFPLWIRFPPDRVMEPEEVRIVHLLYERHETGVQPRHAGLKQKLRTFWTSKKSDAGLQKLEVSSNHSFRVFWTFKKPDDYDFADKLCVFNTPDGTIKRPWDGIQDKGHHDRTPDGETLIIRPDLEAVISYRLRPKTSVVLFPRVTFGLLLALSGSLLLLQFVEENTFDVLLERDMELALFAASSSVVASRLIRNVEIRHGHARWFLTSVGLATALFILTVFL